MPDFFPPLQAFPSGGSIGLADPTTTSSDVLKLLAIGARANTKDGRRFRWAYAGAADLVAGNMLQAAAPIANHQQIAVQAAAAVGDKIINVTLGATLASLNQYQDGFITITTTPGNGYSYRIKSNPAAALSTTLALTLADDDPVRVALTTSSVASLTPNPYYGVIQTPVTTLTGTVVGLATGIIKANTYGWVQTYGLAPALIQGTPAVGQSLSCPATAAGALAINSGTLPVLAQALVVGVDGTNCPVFLMIE